MFKRIQMMFIGLLVYADALHYRSHIIPVKISGISFEGSVYRCDDFFNAILFVFTLFIGAELGRKLYDKPKQAENADTEALKSDDELFDDFAMKYGISDREKDVLRCVFDGSTNQEIAGALFISENTVKFHIKNILKKTGNSNRMELKKAWHDFK